MVTQKKAVGFARTSTDDQSLSIDAQKKTIQEYCKRNNIELLAIYTAQGVSGGIPLDERTTLLDAINFLGEEGASFLIAAKRDRLARDIMVSAMVERLVESNHGQILTCDGVSSEDTPESRMFRQMLDVFAEYERQLIKSRTRAALRAKKAKGEKLGGRVPFGYMVRNSKLVKNEDEQNLISNIKYLRSYGHTYDSIVKHMNKRDSNRGKAFSRSTVYRICNG